MHGQSPHARLKKLATIWDLGINDYEPEPTNILHNAADCGKYAAIELAKGLRKEHTRRLHYNDGACNRLHGEHTFVC